MQHKSLDEGIVFSDNEFKCEKKDCINALYTGRLFQFYMLDVSVYLLRGGRSILLLLLYFSWKILLANTVDPDQMPHYVASDLGLHCLPSIL